MAQATLSPSRPGVFSDAEQTININVAGLRRRLGEYRTYRRTLAELRALSIRQREDLGFAGLDMADIARAAMRRA